MAVLTKIRNRAGLLVFIIGLSLVAFLLMDALNSNTSLLQGGRSNAVAEINGKPVSYQEFEAKYAEALANYKSTSNNPNPDAQTLQYLREQTWNQFIKDNIMKNEYAKLGLSVPADELFELIQGTNPHPEIRKAFTDPNTGVFDPSRVLMYLKTMDRDETGESRKKWLGFEKYIQEDRITNKYNALIKKGLGVPKQQVSTAYDNQNKKVSFSFVKVPYSTISDSSIAVTDGEIEDYISEREKQYTQEASRSLEYVLFEILPSQEDTAKISKYVKSEIPNFAETENDTVYLKLYSDDPYNPKYYTMADLESSVIKDSIFNAEINTIIGPYQEDGYYKAAKIIDKKLIPDSVLASHILVKIPQGQDPTPKLALVDSLKELAESGADFSVLAIQNSEDPGSKDKGGDLGWVKPGEMVPNFNNALFYTGVEGDVLKVFTQFGIHIIKINKSTPSTEGVKVAFLTKEIVPSMDTERELYAQASQFAAKNRTPEAFNNSVDEQNMLIKTAENVKLNDNTIPGLQSARSLVKWAYNAKNDEISGVIDIDDNKFCVAMLTAVKEEGVSSIEDVRGEVETKIRQQKKFNELKKQLQGASDMEGIASSLGQTVQSASNISFSSSFIPGAGNEPKVVGTALGLAKDKVSQPIQGNTGLFVIKVNEVVEAGEIPNYEQYKTTVVASTTSSVEYGLFNAIKESADIVDNRHVFY